IYINKNKRIVIAIASTIISKPADRQELIDKILSIL
ncbi:conserved hypothetical protein, partial [Listeria innocua FSL S4-378]